MKAVSPNRTEKINSVQKPTDNRLNVSYKLPIEKIIIVICVFTSISVITGWFLGYEKILSIIPGSATMKFNTAIVFLIAGINFYLFQKDGKIYEVTFKVLSIISIIIGSITLLDFFGFSSIKIDNIFVLDTFSETNSGIMSPATALCSILIGFGFLGFKFDNKITKYLSRYSVIIVSITSLLAILTYVLLIPSENRTSIFQTMAIHTSLLFFAISIVLILKSKNSILNNMITGQLVGSKIFRQLLPKVIVFPLILANLFLIGLNQKIINADFGIVAYTLILVLLSIMYISFIAYGLNVTESKRIKLQKDLKATNKNLNKFKQVLDKSVILVMINKDYIITHANKAFCEISKYTNKELIGSHYDTFSSGSLSEKEKMWITLNKGNIWSGEKKNKAKDGSYFWVNANIIPFKNEEGIVTEFLSIKQKIENPKLA